MCVDRDQTYLLDPTSHNMFFITVVNFEEEEINPDQLVPDFDETDFESESELTSDTDSIEEEIETESLEVMQSDDSDLTIIHEYSQEFDAQVPALIEEYFQSDTEDYFEQEVQQEAQVPVLVEDVKIIYELINLENDEIINVEQSEFDAYYAALNSPVNIPEADVPHQFEEHQIQEVNMLQNHPINVPNIDQVVVELDNQNNIPQNHIQDDMFNLAHELLEPAEFDLLVNYDSDESDWEMDDDEINLIMQQHVNQVDEDVVNFIDLENLYSLLKNFSNFSFIKLFRIMKKSCIHKLMF